MITKYAIYKFEKKRKRIQEKKNIVCRRMGRKNRREKERSGGGEKKREREREMEDQGDDQEK